MQVIPLVFDRMQLHQSIQSATIQFSQDILQSGIGQVLPSGPADRFSGGTGDLKRIRGGVRGPDADVASARNPHSFVRGQDNTCIPCVPVQEYNVTYTVCGSSDGTNKLFRIKSSIRSAIC